MYKLEAVMKVMSVDHKLSTWAAEGVISPAF